MQQFKNKHIVIIAGEESGDQHAADIIRKLRRLDANITFAGIGGQHMRAAGATLVSDLAGLGVTGLSAVLLQIKSIYRAMRQIKLYLRNTKPDLLILVDYPGFNLRLAAFAKKKLGLRIIYYISPQIWAWKPGRLIKIKQYIDHMAVIFPFEKDLYQCSQIPVSFVGHPILNRAPIKINPITQRVQLGIPCDKKIISILPGSRNHEIKSHMPILIETMCNLIKLDLNLHFVIPIAENISNKLIQNYITSFLLNNITLFTGMANIVAYCSDCIVVASGTAALECALLNKPMCIIYKVSLLTFIIAMQVIRVKYLGFCNLLHNKMVVPELLQYDCNSSELTKIVLDLLYNQELKNKMIDSLQKLQSILSVSQLDDTVENLIINQLKL